MNQRTEVSWGSAAVATAGDVTLELDEALGGVAAWQVTLGLPAIELSIRLASPGQLQEVLDFLETTAGTTRHRELTLGDPPCPCVSLSKDDEFPDRYWLIVSNGGTNLRVTFTSEDAAPVVAVLTDVIGQLTE